MSLTIKKAIVALLLCGLTFGGGYSQTNNKQPPVENAALSPSNMYNTWMKLALLGKNQAEIENYFSSTDPMMVEQIKERIRFAVLDTLSRAGIRNLIEKSTDRDDMNVIIRKVIVEIRYVGMEHDNDLRMTIKEEYGLSLETM